MRERSTPRAAWTWALVFVLALGFAMLEWIVRVGPPGQTAFEQHNLARLEQFSRRATDAEMRIVMLGNSRLKYASATDAELSQQLSVTSGKQVELIRIVNNWATFDDFATFLEPIAELQPNLIVIQVQLLGQERALSARSLIFQDYIDWLASGRSAAWNPGGHDQSALQTNVPCSNDFSAEALDDRLQRSDKWLRFDADGDTAQKARNWVSAQARRGADVLILSVPRTNIMEEVSGVDFDDSAHEHIDALVAEGILLAKYPDVLPEEAYCDVVHMNAKGRETIAPWLKEQLLAASGD